MNEGFKVLDAEVHLEEPFDLWQRHLPEPYRSATKVITTPDGHTRAGSTRIEYNGQLALDTGQTPISSLLQGQSIRRAAQDPHLARAQNEGTPEVFQEGLDILGVDVALLMPTTGLMTVACDGLEPAHALAMCSTYNDWAYSFTRSDPRRFKIYGMLPRQAPQLAAAEARRVMTELGAIGVGLSTHAVDGHLLCESVFDPLWEELDQLGAPIGFHIGPAPSGDNLRARYSGRERAGLVARALAGPYYGMTTIAELIYGGVLERFPHVKPVIMEMNASWLPWLLWRLDDKWKTYGAESGVELSLLPSDYFRRQCYIVMDCTEETAKFVVDYGLEDNVLMSTDYPHADAPFPNGLRDFLALDGLSEQSKRKILWDNGLRMAGLAVAA